MANVLDRLIRKRNNDGIWKGIRLHEQFEPITHSQFADDTIIFGEATIAEARGIMKTLEDYSSMTSQLMNNDKSQLLFFNTNKKTQLKISQVLGIKINELPIKYLGLRLDKGCRQS